MRYLFGLLAIFLLLGCSGMGGDDDDDSTTPGVTETPEPTPTPSPTPDPTEAPTATPLPSWNDTGTLIVENYVERIEGDVGSTLFIYGDVMATDDRGTNDSNLVLCVWTGTWVGGVPIQFVLGCSSDIDYPLPVDEWVPFVLDSGMVPSDYGAEINQIFYSFCVVDDNNDPDDPGDSTC